VGSRRRSMEFSTLQRTWDAHPPTSACRIPALSAAWLVPPLALIGLGNGLLFPPLIGSALSRVRPEQAGSASGSLNTSQQFANSLGVAVIGTLFLTLAGHDLASATTAMAIVNTG
jgi:hypothetical protein